MVRSGSYNPTADERRREAARRRRRNPYGPGTYRPPLPPTGSYDPNIDAERAAAGRGILDTRQDTELGLSRAGQDYAFGVEDLDRGLVRQQEDYTRNTGLLRRQFNILAGQQAQSQRVAGVSGGGAVLQAAAKRKANQGIQQQGLDIGIKRAGEEHDLGIGRLGVGYNRQVTDFGTGLTRAERENTAFGLDLDAQRNFQATQAGWDPPLPPAQQAYQQHLAAGSSAVAEALRRARRRPRGRGRLIGTAGRPSYGAGF